MWYTRVLRDGAKPEPPLEHVRVRPVHSFYYLPKFRWSRFLFGAVTATIFGYVSGVYGNEFIADMARSECRRRAQRTATNP